MTTSASKPIYDLLIKNVRVVRPHGNVVHESDIAIAGGKFVKVAPGIDATQAKTVIDGKGRLAFLGVAAVIAPSYGGLFFRNAFNVGLLLLTCPQAELLQENEHVTLDLIGLQLISPAHSGLSIEPVPDFLIAMVQAGGLLNQLKQRVPHTSAGPHQG